MWFKMMPWKFIVRRVARAQGFLDPVSLMTHISRFAQPADTVAPVELVRMAVVMHARGLINSQAIQHNLDWIWPYWVVRQFDPRDGSFIPRAFSLTHINLTHRNWTAVGIPGEEELPIVDPRGLVTPFYDGWSLDAWIVDDENQLIPSRAAESHQRMHMNGTLGVSTSIRSAHMVLESDVSVVVHDGVPVCRYTVCGYSAAGGWLVISARPYNPEGISFINEIRIGEDGTRWIINRNGAVVFDGVPAAVRLSDYRHGDVYDHLFSPEAERRHVHCQTGMATAAALFPMTSAKPTASVVVEVPLREKAHNMRHGASTELDPVKRWQEVSEGIAVPELAEHRFRYLYESAVRTLILLSPADVYAGPFTYKKFWFRDAVLIAQALLYAGALPLVRRIVERFPLHQTRAGYFHSQEGEWDSNGQVLWLLDLMYAMAGETPHGHWPDVIRHAGQWICRKRTSDMNDLPHAGLMPAGFSAEHFGPNDYYYWDDLWSIAGLEAAARLMESCGDTRHGAIFRDEAVGLRRAVDRSLEQIRPCIKRPAVPVSPYRRLDSGAVGALAAGYPLTLWPANDERILDTAEYLMDTCFVNGGLFHDMTHSGINPYLTLSVAQVLLRAGDRRFYEIVNAIAGCATDTGQWPEAVHPHSGGGCMGDGQHGWAAAEWIAMIRNMFMREEPDGRLVLAAGHQVPDTGEGFWSFGPAPTRYGSVKVAISIAEDEAMVKWEGAWHTAAPPVEVHLPGYDAVVPAAGKTFVRIPLHADRPAAMARA